MHARCLTPMSCMEIDGRVKELISLIRSSFEFAQSAELPSTPGRLSRLWIGTTSTSQTELHSGMRMPYATSRRLP